MPGTWIRMRSSPCRWIVGSRVPTSSIRRRMISSAWRTVRSSVARCSASERRTTSVSPSPETSMSDAPADATEATGCASSRTAESAWPMPSGLPSVTRNSPGVPSCRRIVPTLSRRGRSVSRTSGQSASSRASYTSSTWTSARRCAPPLRSSPRLMIVEGSQLGHAPSAAVRSSVSPSRSMAVAASLCRSTRS